MTANVAGGMPGRQRPFGVSLLATLATLSVVLSLFVALGAGASGAAALVAWMITGVSALAAYGLWTVRPWAWLLALVVWGLGTIDAVLLLSAGTINTNLAIGPLVVLYLLQPSIRAVFRGDG